MAEAIILYDGVCGLCNRLTQFVLPRDRKDRFRFAPLQGPLGQQILEKYGKPTDRLETFYLLVDPGTATERLIERSSAAVRVLLTLGSGWPLAGGLLFLVPRFLRDVGYDFIASHRYGWFGRTDACAVPKPEWRHKFVGSSDLL
jgi:predicted DCC family thiol-disulfide oxidoreductase YuxK